VTVDERQGDAADDISVVICAYDDLRWNALVGAVESVRAQTHPVAEIILVIDHNPELLARARAEIQGIVAVSNNHERGLSGGRNTGLEAAVGSIVGFLDDDAYAEPDWVERLVRLTGRKGCLGAGGRAKPRWLTRQPKWLADEFLWVVGCTYRGVPEHVAPVRNLLGSCFCVRREILRSVGGFRIELGRTGSDQMGCEETDLCIRATHAWPGQYFLYDPDAVVYHDVPGSRATWRYFRKRCFAEGVSKARLASLLGSQAALSSERAYVARTLTGAVARSIGRVARGEPSQLLQAAAIVSGLTFTVAGYTRERVRSRIDAVARQAGGRAESPSRGVGENETPRPTVRRP
jgi:GT2 family glycosyltransferase